MWVFAGILALPLVEIALFVTIGGWIGLWPTLAIVIGTGVAGVAVIRQQGTQAVQNLARAAQLRRNPLGQMADSAVIGLAGVLLILPGFLTDALGLLLLIPPVRALVIGFAASRVQVHAAPGFDGPPRRGADVIDGEFFEIEPDHLEPPRRDRHPVEGQRD